MSVFELRGELLTMLASVEEKDQLEKIRLFIGRLLKGQGEAISDLDGLTNEQFEALVFSLKESEDESKLVSQADVHKMFAQWRGQ